VSSLPPCRRWDRSHTWFLFPHPTRFGREKSSDAIGLRYSACRHGQRCVSAPGEDGLPLRSLRSKQRKRPGSTELLRVSAAYYISPSLPAKRGVCTVLIRCFRLNSHPTSPVPPPSASSARSRRLLFRFRIHAPSAERFICLKRMLRLHRSPALR